jgi:hypothetical protein
MERVAASEDLKVRSGIACRAGDERGALRHTWLERRLLYEMRVDRESWLASGPGAPLPEVLAGIPFQLEKLRVFLDSMIADFSPSQLIDQGPLQRLPEKTKEFLRQSLHEIYVANGLILSLQADLRQAIDALTQVSSKAEAVWREGDRTAKAEYLNLLEAKAARLRDALSLPQGVVLP